MSFINAMRYLSIKNTDTNTNINTHTIFINANFAIYNFRVGDIFKIQNMSQKGILILFQF